MGRRDSTDLPTDEAIDLDKESPDDKPFLFPELRHYAVVHNPIQAKPEDILKFQEKASRMLGSTEAIEGEHFSYDK